MRERVAGWLCVLVLVAVFGWNSHAYVLATDPFWLYTDAPLHLDGAQRLHRLATTPNPSFWTDIWHEVWTPNMYPPLTKLVAVPFMMLEGPTFPAANRSVIVFVALLAFSLHALARRVVGGGGALFAVLIALTTPAYLLHSTNFMLDVPVAGMVTLCALFFHRSDAFMGWRATVCFAVACAFACATKFQAVTFLAGFFLYGLGVGMWELRAAAEVNLARTVRTVLALIAAGSLPLGALVARGAEYPPLIGLTAAFTVVAAAVAFWLARQGNTLPALTRLAHGALALGLFGSIIGRFAQNSIPAVRWVVSENYGADSSAIANLFWRTLAGEIIFILSESLLGRCFFLVFAGSLVVVLLDRKRRQRVGFAVCSLITGLVAHANFQVVSDRYLLAAIPMAALVTAAALAPSAYRFGPKLVVQGVLAISLVGVSLVQWLGWHSDTVPEWRRLPNEVPLVPGASYAVDSLGTASLREGLGRVFNVLPIGSQRPWRVKWDPFAMIETISQIGGEHAKVRLVIDETLRNGLYYPWVFAPMVYSTAEGVDGIRTMQFADATDPASAEFPLTLACSPYPSAPNALAQWELLWGNCALHQTSP